MKPAPAPHALLDARLLAQYGSRPLPRYTSYPSANLWPERTTDEEVSRLYGTFGTRPLSLYVHVPFCSKLCFYCGCNMLIAHRQGLVDRYLDGLDTEVARVAALLPKKQPVVQVHFGGGTPTHLDEAQLRRVVGTLKKHFAWSAACEASIEVHPPVTSHGQVKTLAELGLNRISMGVQDFDPEVQARINRIQSVEQTASLIECARENGFLSVNVDLMYGLPLQTRARFDKTLNHVEDMLPDRIALFGYAHMPRLKKHQRVFKVEELPGPDTRLGILEHAISRLTGMGYVYVGLDHFALPGDELVAARAEGTLRRNFMGYTTCAQTDVLAFGPSSISDVNGAFLQNERDVHAWCERMEAGKLPVVRAWSPSKDDDVRRDVISALFCGLKVEKAAIEAAHGIVFDDYFASELVALQALADDGLVRLRPGRVEVTPVGQLLLRPVAAAFDAYLEKPAERHHAAAV